MPYHCAGVRKPARSPDDRVRAPALLALAIAACAGSASTEPAVGVSTAGPSPRSGPATSPEAATAPPEVHCDRRVPIFEAGRPAGDVCPEAADELGLTLLDLSDRWVPRSFRRAPDGTDVPYRATYVALADEQETDENGERVWGEQHLELYGITPTFRVLGARLERASREGCGGVPEELVTAMAALPEGWGAWGRGAQRRRQGQARRLRQRLEREAHRAGLSSFEELTSNPQLEEYRELERLLAAVETIQRKLQCEGLLDGRYSQGILDGRTTRALREFQLQHMIISRGLPDAPTREALTHAGAELVFRAALRALQERVVDATGLLEDGSASGTMGTVLGRDLNPPELRALDHYGPVPHGAPDLVSPAVEAAARALGWTDPDALRTALAGRPADAPHRWTVAVRLPPRPEYHSSHMELRAEIDRGDFRRGRREPGDRRPTLVLYARHGERDVALMRWATTIGGWQAELDEGEVVSRFKESPAGPVIWRDVVSAPVWLPPASTPDRELVREVAEGVYRVKRSLIGPSYRSAYGLLMVMHHKVLEREDGTRYVDEGIRTHGSVSYRSILTGASHGCHRLFNHLALRLGGFLLAHRRHERRGTMEVDYGRTLVVDDQEVSIRVRDRGHLFELTPPVRAEVLEGTYHGW